MLKSIRVILLPIAALLFLYIGPASAVRAAPGTEPLLGLWVGGYEIDGEWHFVEARFEERNDTLIAGLDFRHDRRIVTFADALAVDGEAVEFEVTRENDRLSFAGRLQEDTFAGTAKSGGEQGVFSLTRVVSLDMALYEPHIGNYQVGERLILLYSLQDFDWFYYHDTVAQRDVRLYPLSADTFFSELGERIDLFSGAELAWQRHDGTVQSGRRADPYLVEEVQIDHDDMTLAGTLLLPQTPGPHPAIVIMHSTGPQNRDYFRRWGHYFAEAGIAALVYDKPGAFDSSHPSLGSFWENTAQDLADAALAGVHYLQARPDIHPDQVGIRTYSNSSWAGPLAAAQSADVAFIVGTAVSGVAQRQADIYQEDLNSVSYYDYPAWAAGAAFSYLRFTREFAIFARQLNLPLPAPVRDYYGVDLDPLVTWADVQQPILIVNGQFDTLVDPVDAVARIEQTLRTSGHDDYTLVVYPEASHGLLQAQGGLRAEINGGRDWVFAPGVMALQTDWVQARFDGENTITPQAQIVESPVPVQPSTHFDAGGRYELLPWFGRPTWQLTLLVLFIVVFLTTAVGLPLRALYKRLRDGREATRDGRGLRWLVWLVSLSALWLIAGLIMTWIHIVHLQAGAFFGLPTFLHSLPVLGPLVAVLLLLIAGLTVRNWRSGRRSAALAGFAVTGLFFIWYLAYWQLLVA